MNNSKRKRVFSGVQPTGKLTIGNYVGALQQWVTHQGDNDTIFCVVDLHTLTFPEDMTPKVRFEKSREVVALYLACGIDPKQSDIFVQSHVREHTELTWVLNCVTPIGWLERMTQYKVKAQGRESVSTGLLDYPVLMAADILLYETDLVPVGDDQKQHLEVTSDIAQRFNHLFGNVFRIPQVVIPKTGARLMGLDDPTAKMSKSTAEKKVGHAVCLLDPENVIKKTVMSAVTDSGQEVRLEHASPGVINLLTIYEVLTKTPRPEIEARFAGKGYGQLKKDVFVAIMETLRPLQERYRQITADPAYVEQVIKDGADRVRPIAERMMRQVREMTGLG